MTAKQAAAHMRTRLKPGMRLTFDNGHVINIPTGLRFNVRATRDGVNVAIEDDGYVDDVTGGDRESFAREHRESIVELVREFERNLWGRVIGEVKWAPILISVSMGPARVVRTVNQDTAPR